MKHFISTQNPITMQILSYNYLYQSKLDYLTFQIRHQQQDALDVNFATQAHVHIIRFDISAAGGTWRRLGNTSMEHLNTIKIYYINVSMTRNLDTNHQKMKNENKIKLSKNLKSLIRLF